MKPIDFQADYFCKMQKWLYLIRKKREKLDYSQEYVAEKLGITTQAYQLTEAGTSKLTVDRLVKLSKIFECLVADLIPDDGTYSKFENNLAKAALKEETRSLAEILELNYKLYAPSVLESGTLRSELNRVAEENVNLTLIIDSLKNGNNENLIGYFKEVKSDADTFRNANGILQTENSELKAEKKIIYSLMQGLQQEKERTEREKEELKEAIAAMKKNQDKLESTLTELTKSPGLKKKKNKKQKQLINK